MGDLIFDPFAGSGTVGRAAAGLKRNFFLTEKEAKYVARMKQDLVQSNQLFHPKNDQPTIVSAKDFAEEIQIEYLSIPLKTKRF